MVLLDCDEPLTPNVAWCSPFLVFYRLERIATSPAAGSQPPELSSKRKHRTVKFESAMVLGAEAKVALLGASAGRRKGWMFAGQSIIMLAARVVKNPPRRHLLRKTSYFADRRLKRIFRN